MPDTLDGRFDLVSLYTFMLIHRLKREPAPGPALAQAVFDAMFSDMDINLREMGVGDMSVGKRVKAMWDAFNGRANAYSSALAAGDGEALEAALARNLWRGAPAPGRSPTALGRLVAAQLTGLEAQPLKDLTAGEVRFLPATEAAR